MLTIMTYKMKPNFLVLFWFSRLTIKGANIFVYQLLPQQQWQIFIAIIKLFINMATILILLPEHLFQHSFIHNYVKCWKVLYEYEKALPSKYIFHDQLMQRASYNVHYGMLGGFNMAAISLKRFSQDHDNCPITKNFYQINIVLLTTSLIS